MDTLPNPHYSKEMVDLLIRIKKHLLTHQAIIIRLSDPVLFDKLVNLHPTDDPLLQGMLQYLMVLAGPDWSQRYSSGGLKGNSHPASGAGESVGKTLFKKSTSLYRGLTSQSGTQEHPQEHRAETGTSGHAVPAAADGSGDRPRKPVRYYRGQPILDDE